MKVYVVEDSDAVRERLITMVSEIGPLEVVGQARSFREALDGIARHQPDMVLLASPFRTAPASTCWRGSRPSGRRHMSSW
jgi:chemotaxis response regulator CheB